MFDWFGSRAAPSQCWRRYFGRRRARNPDLMATRWGRYHHSYDDVATYFDRWAERGAPIPLLSRGYDRDARGYRAPGVIVPRLLERLASESSVLDLGCGTGLAGAQLVRAGHRVTGVDISPMMARSARERGYATVHIADLSCTALPWCNEFDAAICIGVLGDWIPAALVLPKLFDTLRQRCIIAITLDKHAESLQAVACLIHDAGFVIRWQHAGPGFRKFLCEGIDYNYVVASREQLA